VRQANDLGVARFLAGVERDAREMAEHSKLLETGMDVAQPLLDGGEIAASAGVDQERGAKGLWLTLRSRRRDARAVGVGFALADRPAFANFRPRLASVLKQQVVKLRAFHLVRLGVFRVAAVAEDQRQGLAAIPHVELRSDLSSQSRRLELGQ